MKNLIKLGIPLVIAAAMVGAPQPVAAQGCSGCGTCPGQPWRDAAFNIGSDIVWLAQNCYAAGTCQEAIPCWEEEDAEAADFLADFEAVIESVSDMDSTELAAFVSEYASVEYSSTRQAVGLLNCDGQVALLIPIEDTQIAVLEADG